MGEFIALATVNYWDDEMYTENIVLTEVEDFKDAMARIEKYYGTTLEDVNLCLLDGPFIRLSDENLDKLAKDELS